MARVPVTLDADLVIEVMLLSGIRDAQDAVEAVVRDYVIKRTRTETLTSSTDDDERRSRTRPPDPAPG
jgi:Arc/MetJ family transcription regulator